MVNNSATGFISGLNLLKKHSKNEGGVPAPGVDELRNPLSRISFLASTGRVNAFYFWPEWDAIKSVKYVSGRVC